MHIEHVAVWTKDLERLKTFYEKYFHACSGDKYANQKTKFESYFLEFASGARLELMSMPDIPATKDDRFKQFTGYIHLAFSTGSKERVDTVIVTGCVTSGCIRASVIDSFQWGFRTIVPEDCVGDHDERPHHDNLRDVGRRYCDVTEADRVIEWLEDWRGSNRQ